jgi:biotin carboxylase
LTKKAIWLFAGGPMQAYAAKKIKNDGFQLILTDMNPKCYCNKYADEFIELDTFDINRNLEKAKDLRVKYEIKAVLTAAADCHEIVAHVAKYLQLPGINPVISNICRQKYKTREALTEAGLLQPRFIVVDNIQDAREFAKKINVPVVMKATDNSGSRGFSFIESAKDINDDNFNLALENGTSGKIIIEELLQPRGDIISEQSVETLWANGKMYWLNWVDRVFRSDLDLLGIDTDIYEDIGWAVELGHINPAVHDDEIKNNVKDLIYQAGTAIGFHKQKGTHILKADIMLTVNGPVILELTPRLSGGWDSSGTTPARGADFIGGVIEICKGNDFDIIGKYFSFKKEDLFSCVVAYAEKGSTDNIGRKFSIATSTNRENSIKKAINKLKDKDYVIPMG